MYVYFVAALLQNAKQYIAKSVANEYHLRLAKNAHYSLRSFARDLKVSPSHLSTMLQGKSNPSPALALRLIEVLRSSTEDQSLFQLCAEALTARSAHQKKVTALALQKAFHSHQSQTKNASPDEIPILTDLEMISLIEYFKLGSRPQTLSDAVKALGIPRARANNLVSTLCKFELIEPSQDGYRTKASLLIPDQVLPHQKIREFHGRVLAKAQTAIETKHTHERHLQSGVYAIDHALYPRLIELSNQFYESVEQLIELSNKRDQVIALTMQIFPITQPQPEIK